MIIVYSISRISPLFDGFTRMAKAYQSYCMSVVNLVPTPDGDNQPWCTVFLPGMLNLGNIDAIA